MVGKRWAVGGKAARLRAMAAAVAVAVAIHQSIKIHSDNDGYAVTAATVIRTAIATAMQQ